MPRNSGTLALVGTSRLSAASSALPGRPMTAWALLVLLRTAGPADPSAQRALQCLMILQQQGTGGGWPPQAASGVFFRTAVLDYRRYKDIFPAWALALASRHA